MNYDYIRTCSDGEILKSVLITFIFVCASCGRNFDVECYNEGVICGACALEEVI